MKNNIEKIRKACILANPEIVELKFGCRVVSGKSTLFILYINKEGTGTYFNETSSNLGDFTRNTIFDKILGRPIRLADVIFTIQETEEGLDISQDLPDLVSIYWDCKNDNLESQSEATLSFIANLL